MLIAFIIRMIIIGISVSYFILSSRRKGADLQLAIVILAITWWTGFEDGMNDYALAYADLLAVQTQVVYELFRAGATNVFFFIAVSCAVLLLCGRDLMKLAQLMGGSKH